MGCSAARMGERDDDMLFPLSSVPRRGTIAMSDIRELHTRKSHTSKPIVRGVLWHALAPVFVSFFT